jgi:heat shock protein HslJ
VSRPQPSAAAIGLALAVCLPLPAVATQDEGLRALLSNAEYRGIYDRPVRLVEGRFEGDPFVPGGASRPSLRLIGNQIVQGDLNADGEADAAVLLVESSGGSGSFVYLSAFSLAGGKAVNLDTVLISDRVQVRGFAHEDGGLTLDLVVVGEGDPAAFPATRVRKRFRLSGGELAADAPARLGSLSLADLEGTAWTLRRMAAAGAGTRPEGSITASFAEGNIAGNAGCNRYFGTVEDKGRGAVSFGEIGVTAMACPQRGLMEQEQAFLEGLQGADRFGFRFGDLVLSGGGVELIFAPQPR